jgi:head-tail adaptor
MAFIPTIGQMRMVLKLETVNKWTDETGGQNEQYVEFYTGRGYFRKKRGYRAFETGYDETVNIHEAWLFWRQTLENEISKDIRLVYEARVFKVDSYDLVDEKRGVYKFELTEVR